MHIFAELVTIYSYKTFGETSLASGYAPFPLYGMYYVCYNVHVELIVEIL